MQPDVWMCLRAALLDSRKRAVPPARAAARYANVTATLVNPEAFGADGVGGGLPV